MKLFENYLIFLESEKELIKKNNRYVFLFHGTRMPIQKIKENGLTISNNGSIDTRVKKRGIWFTSSKKYAGIYTKQGSIFSKKVGLILLCKLDIKFLSFVERPFNIFDEYIYYKDIHPKDIRILNKIKSLDLKKYPYLKI